MKQMDLTGCPLFQGITAEELEQMWECLGPVEAFYPKGAFLWREGEKTKRMGVVLSGGVHILREDFWGNRSIQGRAGPGELFGEAYACGDEPLGVSVQAAEDSRVLFLEAERLLTACPSACPFHARAAANLLRVLAGKNRMLSRKIEHISQRTTRAKVLSYLSWQARRQGSACFSIPFDRQGLADYLAVDRSALSQELGKMRREGLLDFHKNQFELKGTEQPETE